MFSVVVIASVFATDSLRSLLIKFVKLPIIGCWIQREKKAEFEILIYVLSGNRTTYVR